MNHKPLHPKPCESPKHRIRRGGRGGQRAGRLRVEPGRSCLFRASAHGAGFKGRGHLTLLLGVSCGKIACAGEGEVS